MVMKKHILCSIVSSLLLFTILLGGNGVLADTWTMFRHDHQHSGVSTDVAPAMNSLMWSTIEDTTITGIVDSSPVFNDGRMYIGSNDGDLICLDALPNEFLYDDGDPDEGINDPGDSEYDIIWKFSAGAAIVSSPLYYDGKIIFGSLNGNLYSIYSCIGDEFEHFSIGAPILSSPVLYDEYIYIGSVDGNIYCFKADTLSHTWEFSTGNTVRSSPAAYNDRIYVGSDSNYLYCLNAHNGSEIWSTMLGDNIYSSPSVTSDKVFVGCQDRNLYALWTDDGSVNWSVSTGGDIDSSPAVLDDRVIVGSDDGHLYCFNTDDGSTLWDTLIGDAIQSSPVIADEKVYIGCDDHSIYCLNLTDGAILWSYETDDVISSSPAVIYERLYVASESGTLYCFRNYNPPEKPSRPDGPSIGIKGYEYEFLTETIDNEGDPVYYQFDWGDGKISDWLGPFDSGETVAASHTYGKEDNFSIMVKSKDAYELESEWSDPHYIEINILEVDDVRGGLGLHATISNIGVRQLWRIAWTISYEGGRIQNPANEEFTDEILNIPAGESEQITTGPFFEIGRIQFTIDVEDGDGDNVFSTSYRAFAFGYVIILLPW